MKSYRTAMLAAKSLAGMFAASSALAGTNGVELPGPGIFALLALGIVGAIGISRLRK
jgi:hypothetical protein